MTEKAKNEPKFVVAKREKKTKPDFFANVTPFRHPVSDLLDFNTEDSTPHSLDSQNLQTEISKENNLDIQTEHSRTSKKNNLDVQSLEIGYPKNKSLDSQTETLGNPNTETLDSLIAKEPTWIAKETTDLDSLISKPETLDIQKTKITKEKGKWGKYDRSRDRKGIFLRTDDDLTKQFKKFCIDHNLEFAQATEIAWQRFMDSLDSQKSKGLDSLIATNNLITSLSKTKSLIIKLYLAYNSIFNPETKWKTSDDKVGVIFNNADIRLIEVGIIQTHGELYQQTETGKFVKKDTTKIINAFSYYRQKIEANIGMFENDDKMAEILLSRHREHWKKWTGKNLDLDFLKEGN